MVAIAAAVSCVDCHMPRVTYGLLEGMMSHRVTTPDPKALLGRTDQPDACTQCHVDRARDWANSPSDGSRVELDLLGGDPVQRALAAHALARPGAVGDVERRKARSRSALEDDYPAVRWFAWRGYRALAPRDAAIAAFDFMGRPCRAPRSDRKARRARASAARETPRVGSGARRQSDRDW